MSNFKFLERDGKVYDRDGDEDGDGDGGGDGGPTHIFVPPNYDLFPENLDGSFKKTSTSQGARPKTANYDKMLSEVNMREVENNFPEIRPDVIVRQMGGKIQISIFGTNEWQNFKKPNGKINTFTGDLKKALGPPLKKFESDYFIKLKRIYPYMNERDFELEYGKDQFRIRLRGGKNAGVTLFKKDGELKKRIDTELRNKLGLLAKDIVEENEKENEVDRTKIEEINEELENEELDAAQTANLIHAKSVLEGKIDERDTKTEMKIKDKVKAIFKKYGLTIITVTSAVITVISAIVSNLGIGLSKLAKNLGNGLKDLGKKLGAILPGMVGAIASFIFRTAGEAIGFLAKNAWLLIIAVVIAAVDRFKKKK